MYMNGTTPLYLRLRRRRDRDTTIIFYSCQTAVKETYATYHSQHGVRHGSRNRVTITTP